MSTSGLIQLHITAPAGALIPVPAGVHYRTQHPKLFAAGLNTNNRQWPYGYGNSSAQYSELWYQPDDPRFNTGATQGHIDWAEGYTWRSPGGDMVDATQTQYNTGSWTAAVPWANITATSDAGGETTADITTALQYIQTGSRFCAFLLHITNVNRIPELTTHNGGSTSRIAVTYADGTTATLTLNYMGSTIVGASRTTPGQVSGYAAKCPASSSYNVLCEFDRPAKAVASATLVLDFAPKGLYSAYPSTFGVFVADPPTALPPVVSGLAASYPLDVGLSGAPGIIASHRVTNASVLGDFYQFNVGLSINNMLHWSPEIFTPGATPNLNLLPHKHQGKFIWGNSTSKAPAMYQPGVAFTPVSVVPDTYSAEGFAPLAPGLGAVRIEMPYSGVGPSSWVNSGGTIATDAHLYLPASQIGLADHIFVREYIRFAPWDTSVDAVNFPTWKKSGVGNNEYLDPAAASAALAQPTWSGAGGKFGVSPTCWVGIGPNSGNSGGGHGYQTRDGWRCTPAQCDPDGPSSYGVLNFMHWYDFGSYGPPAYAQGGFNGADTSYGQRNGFGSMLYFNQWYCREKEIQLNTIDFANTTFQADGVLRVYIDGMLAYEKTGLVFRTTAFDGDIVIISPPANCTVTGSGNTRVITANSGWFGTTTFTYQVTNLTAQPAVSDAVTATLTFSDPALNSGVRITDIADPRMMLYRINYTSTSITLRSGKYKKNPDNEAFPGVRDLGVMTLWDNWFNGGVTPSTQQRVMFRTGLAIGTSYIGPMGMP